MSKTKSALPKPTKHQSSGKMYQLNLLMAFAIEQSLSIKQLRCIIGIDYLQRRSEEVYPGEVWAIYYEVTKDASWSYESCREMLNKMSKLGWVEKHKLGNAVAYTLSPQSKTLLKRFKESLK